LQLTNGYLPALLAYAGFSFADASVKALGEHLSIFEIGFFLNVFAGLILVMIPYPDERWYGFWRMERPFAVQGRAICGVAASLLGIYAFTSIPLTDAYALIFLAPLFVTILSVLVLKEKVGMWRWSGVVLGFAGVLLVVKPGFRDLQWGHLCAAGAGLSTGIAVIVLRMVGSHAKRTSILGTLFLYLICTNGAILLYRGMQQPGALELAVLAFAGLCFGLGQWAFILATRYGTANQIPPMHYSQLIWAVLFSALIFKDYPDPLGVIGLSFVASAGILPLIREQILKTSGGRIHESARRSRSLAGDCRRGEM
jgi:drug/metabolite transporter (DMT)-like permease